MTVNISIITITQIARRDFLKVLAKCIQEQIIPSDTVISEWIILDTSLIINNDPEPIFVQSLSDLVIELKSQPNLPKINYRQATKATISGWRNEANKFVTGDLIVCFDDDDYYYPTAISHAYELLKDRSYLIAGCDRIMMYDIYFNEVYQFDGYKKQFPHHSTNNCMVYWREYLHNHHYDENIQHAEEASFTNNYQEPMAQMDTRKYIINFSHNDNTFDKRCIIFQNRFMLEEARYIHVVNEILDTLIKNSEILTMYREIFDVKRQPITHTEYDIVYLCGLSIPWKPQQTDLGGSEQAVLHLSQEWAAKGKRVIVFANTEPMVHEGVTYEPFYKFRFWDKYQTLIIWRIIGIATYMPFDLRADKIIVDLHDMIYTPDPFILSKMSKIDMWMFKSEFHKYGIESAFKTQFKNAQIVPNGLRTEMFSSIPMITQSVSGTKNSNLEQVAEQRNPFRFCYCSCYTRGLIRILEKIWPIIWKFEPRAELHVYYGMHLVTDQELIKRIRTLLSQPGVMDHDRQPVEAISREKHLSTYQLYYTDSMAEIDCISIRESLVAGCIPLLADINLFHYRDGILLKWFPDFQDYNTTIAYTILEIMNNSAGTAQLREQLAKSKTIISWTDCADIWLKLIAAK